MTWFGRNRTHLAKDYDEDKHPRGEGGRWAAAGGGDRSKLNQSGKDGSSGSPSGSSDGSKKERYIATQRTPQNDDHYYMGEMSTSGDSVVDAKAKVHRNGAGNYTIHTLDGDEHPDFKGQQFEGTTGAERAFADHLNSKEAMNSSAVEGPKYQSEKIGETEHHQFGTRDPSTGKLTVEGTLLHTKDGYQIHDVVTNAHDGKNFKTPEEAMDAYGKGAQQEEDGIYSEPMEDDPKHHWIGPKLAHGGIDAQLAAVKTKGGYEVHSAPGKPHPYFEGKKYGSPEEAARAVGRAVNNKDGGKATEPEKKAPTQSKVKKPKEAA